MSFADFWSPPGHLPDPQPYQSTRCPLIVNQREADALREVLGDQMPDVIVSEPVPLTEIRELLAMKPKPRRTLHCHPSVTVALKLAAPSEPDPPSFMDLGRIGDLCGIDVYENDEMMAGVWEIREGAVAGKGGKLVNFGVLRSVS